MNYVYIVFDPNDEVLGVYASKPLAEADIKHVLAEGMFNKDLEDVFVFRDFVLITQ